MEVTNRKYVTIGNFDSVGTVVRSLNFEAEDQITDSSLQSILRAALQGYQKSTRSMKKVARKRKYVSDLKNIKYSKRH